MGWFILLIGSILLFCALLWLLLWRLLGVPIVATLIALAAFFVVAHLARGLSAHCFVYDVLNPQAAWYGCLLP